MANRTYYYIKPKASAIAVLEPVKPVRLTVSSGAAAVAPAIPTPMPRPFSETLTPKKIAQPTERIMDLSFVRERSEGAYETRPMSAIVRLTILVASIVAIYFGGVSISQAAVEIKGDITGLTDKGVTKLALAATLIAEQDFTAANDNFKAAENLFSSAQQQILELGQTNLYLSGLGGSNFQLIAGQKLIDAGLNLSQSGQLLLSAVGPAKEYLGQVNTGSGNSKDYPKLIAELLTKESTTIDEALARVTKANALLMSLDERNLDADYAKALVDAKTKTADLQTLVEVLATVAKEVPRALGFNSPKIITVLNQNNNELRPTGGFIGSIATVKLYKGEIQDVKVDITQRIDGQNPYPSIELPEPLKQIAWTGTFGTRDSNFYPDFAKSATTFQQLYEEAKGGTSDMIIAINPTIIEDLLTIVGPIVLPNGMTLDASNFVVASQEQIEIKDQKKENPKQIFNDFAPILMERVLNANGEQLKQINAAVVNRLRSKDIMIYAKNKDLEEALAKLNFAGSMPTVSGDFLSVVRANLGATKSSQNVKQEIAHTANINLDGEIEDSLVLTYTHNGSHEFPDGTNKDYVRIYVPKGSEIISLTGHDSDTKFEVFEENDKTVFAAWLTTNPGEKKQLIVNYRPKIKIAGQYQLYVSRQSGANNTWLDSTMRLSPALSFDNATTARSKSLYSGMLLQDAEVKQGFERNL